MTANIRAVGNAYNAIPPSIPTGLPASEVGDISIEAIEYSCDLRFHRSFLLPPNPVIGRSNSLRVTYADAGYSPTDANEEVPTLLWCGGMFGGRYQAIADDKEAKKQRVRFIAVDKPGIGGTGKVNLDQRIPTWLDIVPALLKHLGIKHISLASHSNGAIYILNTFLHQRELLDPDKPYIALFAPWVLPSRSGKFQLSILQTFPNSILGTWHHIARFVNGGIAPMLSSRSGPPFSSLIQISKLVPSSAKQIGSATDSADLSKREEVRQAILQGLLTKYIFTEEVDGASQEVLLCLQKGRNLWGDWKDYDELVQLVVTGLAKDPQPRPKIKIQSFFASTDELVGTKGQAWFEKCWNSTTGQDESGGTDGPLIDFESEVVPDTDHNSLLPVEKAAMVKVLRYVSHHPV